MSFSLHVVKMPDGVTLAHNQQSFPAGEVTLGRGASNIWVLDDPERFLSSSHCKLISEGDRYLLTDTSTNGTFLNGSHEPVGKGNTVAIHHNDVFDIGEYSFKLEASSAAAVDSPFDDFSGGFDHDFSNDSLDKSPEDDFFASTSSANPFDDGGIHLDDAFSSQHNQSATDPLKALDENGAQSNDPFAISSAIPQTDFGFGDSKNQMTKPSSTFNDGGSALSQSIPIPQSQPAQTIPDNWDDDFDFMSDMAPSTSAASNASQAASADHIEDPFKDMTPDAFSSGGAVIPEDFSIDAQPTSPVSKAPFQNPSAPPSFTANPFPVQPNEPTANPVNQSAAFKTPRPGRAAVRPQRQPQVPVHQDTQPPALEPTVPAPQYSQSATQASTDTGFITALGLDPTKLSPEQQQHINQTAGSLLRETTQAMMGLLRSRANIKNEFRMNVTTIQPAENNPLKFSVGVDEALENMFVRKNDAYKDPIAAFIEGFEGVAEHQVAIIAGIRFAFENMIEQFNPDQLEKIFNRGKKGAVISGIQKARNWGMFEDHYKNMTSDMEGAFQQLFGDNFVQAYEDQLRRLKAENKAKSP